MKKSLYLLAAGLFTLLLSAALKTPPGPDTVPSEIVIRFDRRVSVQAVESARERIRAEVRKQIPVLDVQVWRLQSDHSVEQALQDLEQTPGVIYAEPNYRVHTHSKPNDPEFGQLWAFQNTGQNGGQAGADIRAVEAWDLSTGSEDVLIGVVDTGIDFLHDDLRANIYTNPGEDPWTDPGNPATGNGVDDDQNGRIDDWIGWNFVDNNNNAMDDNNHGTHCAGTIGSVGNNAVGVVGVNWRVALVPLKFLDVNGSGSTADAAEAIVYASDMGVSILNNSWGGGAFSETLYDAIEYANEKGVLFVAAAGNDGVNTDIYPDYPASFDLPNIISVAASDQSDQRALWGRGGGGDDCGFVCSNAMAVTPGSNFGPKTVDLGAPGKEIYSTVTGNRYLRLTGTSMAAPHVAGVSGLLLARYPDLTHQQVKQRLLGTVDVVAAFEGITVSGGRLNAAAALQQF